MAISMGMDPTVVQNMGRQMQTIADNIQNTLIPQIDTLVQQIPSEWSGPDATKFQGWWQNEHRQHLNQVATDLHGLGQSALNNAQEQIDVSGR
ncbi:MAG TPA: WXG100 family type VII secretion target [Acidimicrobiales bacterium]|nr:WXG100 family type VII secretion target [Acidimicrobiales bacterium]